MRNKMARTLAACAGSLTVSIPVPATLPSAVVHGIDAGPADFSFLPVLGR
jgi:hypothetical protein